MAAERDMTKENPSLIPPLQRQLSLSEPPHSSRSIGLCSGIRSHRRCWTLAEYELEELSRYCAGAFSCWTSPCHRKADDSLHGNIIEEEDDGNLFPYKSPSRFKVFCRKLRTEARNVYRQNSSMMLGASRFQYDELSYAMNFDDGRLAQMQDFQGNNMQMRLHSARFSGSIPALAPTVSPEPSSMR